MKRYAKKQAKATNRRRLKAQERLRHQRAQAQLYIEAIHQALIDLDFPDTLVAGNRSGCQNLALAMPSFHGVPYGHGHAPDLTPTTLEPDSIRSPGLYSDTGSASGKP
jgi:hypothetical protein